VSILRPDSPSTQRDIRVRNGGSEACIRAVFLAARSIATVCWYSAVNVYIGDGKKIPCILNFSTPRRWAVSFWSDCLVPKEKSPFINSLCCLSYGRSTASSKASSPQNAHSFNLQYPLFSWRPSSSCLGLHPQPSVTFILPSISPSITWFRRQIIRNTWPTRLVFLLCIVSWRQIQGEHKKFSIPYLLA
jgi:hypothetical protein